MKNENYRFASEASKREEAAAHTELFYRINGETMAQKIFVNPDTDTGDDVVHKIAHDSGLRLDALTVILNGVRLQIDTRLKDVPCESGDTLQLSIKGSGGGRGGMDGAGRYAPTSLPQEAGQPHYETLFRLTKVGESICSTAKLQVLRRVGPSTTGYSLRRMIAAETGISWTRLELKIGAKVMNDFDTLSTSAWAGCSSPPARYAIIEVWVHQHGVDGVEHGVAADEAAQCVPAQSANYDADSEDAASPKRPKLERSMSQASMPSEELARAALESQAQKFLEDTTAAIEQSKREATKAQVAEDKARLDREYFKRSRRSRDARADFEADPDAFDKKRLEHLSPYHEGPSLEHKAAEDAARLSKRAYMEQLNFGVTIDSLSAADDPELAELQGELKYSNLTSQRENAAKYVVMNDSVFCRCEKHKQVLRVRGCSKSFPGASMTRECFHPDCKLQVFQGYEDLRPTLGRQ